MRISPKAHSTQAIASVSIQYSPGAPGAPSAPGAPGAPDAAGLHEQLPLKTELMAGLMRCMSRLVGNRADVKLLDLGCGSGIFTIPLARNLGYQTTGADCSLAMLQYASRKPNSEIVTWDRQDATSLTYEPATFDIIFMSNLLDLVKNPHEVVRECSRVLKPGGVLVSHYGALEDILREPEHKFFPETVELDYLRTPARKQVETWFRQADLKEIASDRDTYRPWKTAQDRLISVEEKTNIVLKMLDFDSYNKGLSRLRAYTASNPMDPWLRELTVTTTYGRK